MMSLLAACVLATAPSSDHLGWFRDARLGMFIHWGPVSLRGTEIGWSRGDSVPIEEYDNLYKRFNPTGFNADEWMTIAKRAGFRYVVPTAKHHDGFCLWPSRETSHNIMASPFHRDIMGEITGAAKSHGMTMCSYYSILDWRSPLYGTGSPGGTTIKPMPNMARHMMIVREEVAELIKNYGIKMVWFDGQWEKPYTRDDSIGLNNYLRGLSPDLIINDRVNSPKLQPGDPVGDYKTPEQTIGSYNTQEPWETCMTLGDQWAYRPNDHYKTVPQILKVLIQTVTGDGNLLLNVGPDETGRIPAIQQKLLTGLGDWVGKYGQSIYGTRGGPFKNGEWGGTTRKGKTVYVHILNWGNGEIQLPSLPARITKSRVLQKGIQVICVNSPTGLTLKLKGNPPSEPTTLRIDLDKDAWSLGTIESK